VLEMEMDCPASVGSKAAPFDPMKPGSSSNMTLDEDDPMMGMVAGLGPGTYNVCVTVDTAGPMSNAMPIPEGKYEATAYSRNSADPRDNVMRATVTVGNIVRNCTSVNIAYLTSSDKYNQRLIITNRGDMPAPYDLNSFTTEVDSDVTVELSDMAMQVKEMGHNVIPPGGQVVLRVSDLLSFTGNSRKYRTAATLDVGADVDDVQVATTQVNLSDGSTDTVIYASEGGVGLN